MRYCCCRNHRHCAHFLLLRPLLHIGGCDIWKQLQLLWRRQPLLELGLHQHRQSRVGLRPLHLQLLQLPPPLLLRSLPERILPRRLPPTSICRLCPSPWLAPRCKLLPTATQGQQHHDCKLPQPRIRLSSRRVHSGRLSRSICHPTKPPSNQTIVLPTPGARSAPATKLHPTRTRISAAATITPLARIMA